MVRSEDKSPMQIKLTTIVWKKNPRIHSTTMNSVKYKRHH